MVQTTMGFFDDEGPEYYEDELDIWEQNELLFDAWAEEAEAIEEEDTQDLYDQAEYMLDHLDEE